MAYLIRVGLIKHSVLRHDTKTRSGKFQLHSNNLSITLYTTVRLKKNTIRFIRSALPSHILLKSWSSAVFYPAKRTFWSKIKKGGNEWKCDKLKCFQEGSQTGGLCKRRHNCADTSSGVRRTLAGLGPTSTTKFIANY